MSKFLTGLWMMKKMMMIHDPIGDYSLSPKRAPDSSWHLPRGLTEEPRPCQCRAQEEVRDAEGSPLMNSGGRAKLDCEDDAWDRRGVSPDDGHPGFPLPAPLQDRLRQPEARDQEVRQMSSPPVRERELQQHQRGAGVRQDVSPPAVADGGQVQGDLHGRREALLHADLVAQCSVMLCGSLCCSSPPYQTQPMRRSAVPHFCWPSLRLSQSCPSNRRPSLCSCVAGAPSPPPPGPWWTCGSPGRPTPRLLVIPAGRWTDQLGS